MKLTENLATNEVDAPDAGSVNGDAENVEEVNESKEQEKKGGSKGKRICIAFVVAMIVFIIIILLWKLFPRTVCLNDYLVVEFSGYETVGEAKVYIDEVALKLDCGDKIKFTDNDEYRLYENMYGLFGLEPADVLIESVNVYATEQGNLSNGDIVTVKWECDENQIEQFLNVDVTFEEVEFEVVGLTELVDIDIFEKLNVSFNGYSPKINANCSVDDGAEMYNSLIYEADKAEGLAEGDEISVHVKTIDNDNVDTFLAQYGYKMTQNEKKYTVVGDGKYVSDISEIATADFDEIMQHGKDTVISNNSETLSSYSDTEFVSDVTYVGGYFLREKSDAQVDIYNKLYMLYEVTNTITATSALEKVVTETFTHYTTVQYDGIVIDKNGETFIEAEYCKLPDDKVEKKIYFYASKYGEKKRYNLRGYEAADEVMEKLIKPMLNDYDCMQ